ncbi:MAG: threonine ammonia-lyase [Chloroflexota bacterium]
MAYLADHFEEIRAASGRIEPYVRATPNLAVDSRRQLVMKPECLQVTGSFKVRGAFNAVLRLKQAQPEVRGVITISSGNHAQAVALAARTVGLPAVVVMPADVNPAKLATTRAIGAEVIVEGVTMENRDEVVKRVMEDRGLTLVHPYDHWDVIHGQGTAALEILADDPDVDLIAAPIGGGGLLSGTALVAKAQNRRIRVVGVEPAAADDAFRTFRSGQIQTLQGPARTIADGVRTTSIGSRAFEVMVERGLVDDVVTVTEEEIEEAMVLAWTKLKLTLEPTGCLPIAAYVAGKLGEPTVPLTGLPRRLTDSDQAASPRRVALILSGGNFDRAVAARLLAASAEVPEDARHWS